MRIKPVETGNKGCVHQVSTQGKRKLAAVLIGALSLTASSAFAADAPPAGGKPANLAEIGKKLSNPLSDVWALFTEFDLNWNSGNLYDGNYKRGGAIIFQPVMPFKLTKDLNLDSAVERPVWSS